MFREQYDKERLLVYWRDEQNSSKWYKASNYTDDCTDESFLDFCSRHRIFEINECALLYVEEVEPNIMKLHFSVLRGTKPDLLADLIEIRNMLFREGATVIFGWVLRENHPLKRLCEKAGLYWNGRVFEEGKWFRHCYAMDKRDLIVAPDAKKLILST